MHSLASLRALVVVAATLASTSYASIGPVTDLHIVNAEISPDGFTRAGVLAEGTFPGPVIAGSKVHSF